MLALLLAVGSALGAWALCIGLGAWGRFHVAAIRNRDFGKPIAGEATRLWFLWWAAAAGAAVVGAVAAGHPLAGLALALLFPVVRFVFILLPRKKNQQSLERSALAFFHGLQGLLRAGFSLPTALFRLAQTLETPFAVLLRGSLASYDQGKTLSRCLERFQARSGLAQAGLCLDLLEQAHHRGLSLGPFLERVLPWLEEEARDQERVEQVRTSALVQAILASLLPWVVVALAIGPPGQWTSTTWMLAAFGLTLQVAGLWVVGQVARFE